MTESFSTNFTLAPSAVTVTPQDAAIVSETEAGYVIARKRYSRQRWQFDVSYPLLDETDYGYIMELWGKVGTSGLVSWTFDGKTYTCRFLSPGVVTRYFPPKLHDVSFSLLTV